jgi:hypothetical protein
MALKLGKKPARKGAITLRLADVVDLSKLPTPPVSFGNWENVPYQMFSNDQYGCCVWAGAANETMDWGLDAGKTVSFRDRDVLAAYTAVTGFRPNNPSTDNGTDMGEAASYRRKTGIVDTAGRRHRVDAYARIKARSMVQLKAAMWLLGGVGIGIEFPAFAMDQFEAGVPWKPQRRNAEIDGGHYVAALGINSRGNIMVATWGKIHEMTPAFLERYNDESIAWLSFERLVGKTTPEGFDPVKLREFLDILDG